MALFGVVFVALRNHEQEGRMDYWPYDEVDEVAETVGRLRFAFDAMDPIAALNQISVLAERLPGIAADLCKIASRAGYTNKRIANSLGVPPSALRGLREEARA